MTYQEKLEAFAAQAELFICARVRKETEKYGRWERYIEDGSCACACCGSQQVRTLYPVAPEGDGKRLMWVGGECLKALTRMGKVQTWDNAAFILVEV